MKATKTVSIAVAAVLSVAAAMTSPVHAAAPPVSITEWMYSGAGAGGANEFMEFTNTTAAPISMVGWSFDDDSRLPGTVSLTAFGILAPGESAILAEAAAAAFRTEWGLASTVKIIGGNSTNLSRNDEINLYNGSNTLVDRLTYGDQNFPGTIRTQNRTGRPGSAAALGANAPGLWVLSSAGDVESSFASLGGDIGSPGFTSFASAVPEPETYALMLAGLGLVIVVARRRNTMAPRLRTVA